MIKPESTFMGFDKSYHIADIAYFGAPFDGTASFRKGSVLGPAAIRNDSYGLESFSPYQNLDLENDTSVIDLGDLVFDDGTPAAVLATIRTFAQQIILDNKRPLMVGGEHLVTLPVVEVLHEKHPDLMIVHLDAHADLRLDYEGERLSHATVMRCIHDSLGDGRIHQFGIRSGTKEEFGFSREHCNTTNFNLEGMNLLHERLGDKPVYVTIDLDVLDPSVFPGTGTQEPGGITFKELMEGILSLRGLHIVGADVVELAPNLDPSGVSTSCACKVVREMALLLSDKERGENHG